MKDKLLIAIVMAGMTGIAWGETIFVPARANPWLAGMTNGSVARRGDSVPDESPVRVAETSIEAGATYNFSATGLANHGTTLPSFSANGEDLISHYLGAENGIADITAPFVSLIGVFLGPDQPDETPAPSSLDFRDAAAQDYQSLTPALKQPFVIGNGLTSSGEAKRIIAPRGATRLYLGIMDEYGWNDNEGGFTVEMHIASTNSKTQPTSTHIKAAETRDRETTIPPQLPGCEAMPAAKAN